MNEIPGAPISRHDIDVIREQITKARTANLTATEIHISARRQFADNLRVFSIPIRRRQDLALNEGLLIFENREPIPFDFETPTGAPA